MKNRTSEVVVKKLTADELKKVREAKQKEVDSWVKYKVVQAAWVKYKIVQAASKAGLPARLLMRMRWTVTRKNDGFKARLVLLGYQASNLGQVSTASPTCSRRARQVFFAMSATLGFQVQKGDVKNAFLQGGDYEDTLGK